MAVEFKVDYTRGSDYSFAPQDIKINPELNGRHELPDIEWLIQDIVNNGQIQAVLIRSDGGTPVLVCGFSRWRAVVEINKRKLTPVPLKLKCSYFRGDEKAAFLANIAENRVRNATTPIDDGYNCIKLERYGMSLEEIAKIYNEDEAWVENRMAIASLTPEAKEAFKTGNVKLNAAAALAKLSEEQQRKAVTDAKEKNKKISMGSVKKMSGKDKNKTPTLRQLIEHASRHDDSPEVREFCLTILGKIPKHMTAA